MEKNLNNGFRETMEEAKAMLTKSAVNASVSGADPEDVMANLAMLRLVTRLIDLSCDMFEKQDRLADKLDKVLDGMYLV